ncbi:hypothetical protein WMF27_30515 [Sorangium sp. So ce281]|uniref:hypothetical protein n=1 Tax=unclassified Sorangium TaxID=2621164 RepID=UPI003F641DDF
MSNDIQCINDRRGLVFTIDREPNPVYQLESSAWANAENRWAERDIPPEIRDKVASLNETGKPGAFVQFLQGDVGVYVICEKNIKNLPETACDDLVVQEECAKLSSARRLAAYDLVICAKNGTIRAESGETFETREGDYYVVRCQSWGRFVLNPSLRPGFVETTKEVLLLLEGLHRKNFLSMSPDPTDERLPPDVAQPTAVPVGINCYVLNLSRFKR